MNKIFIHHSFIFSPDASRILVSVGFGFFLEFTLPEALKFIDKKTDRLNERVEKLTSNVSKVKAHIKLVLEVCNN